MKKTLLDQIKEMCPSDAKVYFNQNVNSISIFLSEDIGVAKRDYLKCSIMSFIGSKMLHASIKTIYLYY